MSGITKRHFISLGVGALALAGGGYAWSQSAGGGAGKPTFEDVHMTLAEMQAVGGLIVDIRRPDEWAETGVIEGATLLTFESPTSFLAQIGPQIADGRPLVLICRSGNRSRLAAEALAPLIPNRIISVNGGMSERIAQGAPVVKPVCATC